MLKIKRIDHVAVCVLGVWDKGDEPTGIRSEAREDSAMADEDEKKSKEDGLHEGRRHERNIDKMGQDLGRQASGNAVGPAHARLQDAQ